MSTLPTPRLTQKSTKAFLVDDHDEVYPYWKELGLKNRVLIHIDEHSDFQWIHDQSPLNLLKQSSTKALQTSLKESKNWTTDGFVNRELHLGNYLCKVFEEKLVRQWYWVIPDPMWNDEKNKERVWLELNDHYKNKTGQMTQPYKTDTCFRTTILDVETFVGPLSSLPCFDEEVILNIDVDFLTFNNKDWLKEPIRFRRALPWIWPEELLSKLKEKSISPITSAVAYSVNGGFTPIAYKFFGQLLKDFLSGSELPLDYNHLKKAILFRYENKLEEAKKLLEIIQDDRLKAASHYQLTMIHYEENSTDNAREEFYQTRALDPEYDSKYNNLGPIYNQYGLHQYALEEYKMAETLIPGSTEALYGKAISLYQLGNRKEAERLLKQVLQKNSWHLGALLNMGFISLEKNEVNQSLRFFHQSLESDERPEPNVHLGIGICYIAQKEFSKAKLSLREALKYGCHTPLAYWLLARTYKKLGHSKKSRELFFEAIRLNLLMFKRSDGPKQAWLAFKDILNYGRF